MNNGTKIRTALAVAIAFYVAIIKTDLTSFGNPTVDVIYQIVMKAATFAVIFLVTYYNNDYTEEGCKGTALTRYLKEMKKKDTIGEDFIDTDIEPNMEGEDEADE